MMNHGANLKPASLPRAHLTRQAGFTITELLVVIAIMAVLSAILLPALNKGRARSQAISCLNNLRQLQLAWQMYTDDNRGELPPNNFVEGFKINSLSAHQGASWCPGNARLDATTENIKRGNLFPYAKNATIYHCPSDDSRILASAGSSGTPRTRSYSMSGSINAEITSSEIPSFRKFSEMMNPHPSQVFVFIDAHEDSITDAHFAVAPHGKTWIELPSERHGQAANLSFADGHIERWRWTAPKKFEHWRQQTSDQEDLRDLRRLQSALRQK